MTRAARQSTQVIDKAGRLGACGGDPATGLGRCRLVTVTGCKTSLTTKEGP